MAQRTTAISSSRAGIADPAAAAATRRGVKAATAPKPLPEVHIMGEIVGGTGFGEKSVCCKWALEAGDKWDWLGGSRSGQTHTISADDGGELAVWSHPLDVHFAAGTMSGWPRLQVQVWQQDPFGRLELTGYGFTHIPAATGMHEVSFPVWRPLGTPTQELSSFFLGAHPMLKSSSVVFSTAPSERLHLVTTGTGTVHARFEIVFRNMEAYGVEW